MPEVSIVIPCYNHGHYLEEALLSIESARCNLDIEIIIVNDGSTDENTISKLTNLEEGGYRVVHQKNAGLSAARNTGIQIATANIIVTLDADNRLTQVGLTLPLSIFKKYLNVSVVYGDRMLFESQSGRISVGDFNLQKLMLTNYIDACAMFRKEMWTTIDGYDEKMRLGWEDWEFWLHAAFKGYTFYYLPQILFDYRVVNNSMVHKLNKHKSNANNIIDYIVQKHPNHFGPRYLDWYFTNKFRQSFLGSFGKLILKLFFPKRFDKLVVGGKMRRYW